jgi:hypothetical protein
VVADVLVPRAWAAAARKGFCPEAVAVNRGPSGKAVVFDFFIAFVGLVESFEADD